MVISGIRPGAAFAPLLAALLAALAGASPAAPGKPATGTLHFTTGLNNTLSVRKATYVFDGAAILSIPEPTPLARAEASMGLAKARNGNLVAAGGGANVVFSIDMGSGSVTSWPGTWVIPRAIAFEPDESSAWIADIEGSLFRMQPGPAASPVRRLVLGAERKIHYLTFRDAYNAYYSSENESLIDSAFIGVLDTRTMVATRWMTLPGEVVDLVFDSYTKSLILCGTKFLVQVDTATRTVSSTRSIVNVNGAILHSCVADGQGHLIMADYIGTIHLMDYSASRTVGDTSNPWAKQFVLTGLGHFAPLIGPGSIQVKPPVMKGLKAVYADADGDGRVDQTVIEVPKPSVVAPTRVSLRDPFTGLPHPAVTTSAPLDGTHFRLDFPASPMAFGTTFAPGPYASVLEDTNFFDQAPFEVKDGVGPQLLSAESVPPQRSGDKPVLRVAFSEALKVDDRAKTPPFIVVRNGVDVGLGMSIHSAKHLGGNVWQFAFASTDFPKGGDSVVVIAGTPQLTDAAGNPSNQVRKVPVTGLPPPVFAMLEPVLPRVTDFSVPAGSPSAGRLLAVDDARPHECLNCPEGPVKTAFEAALQAPRPSRFQPWLFTAAATGPFRYDLAFYSNLGACVNRAAGMVDASVMDRAAKDKDGVARLRLYWWPVADNGQAVRTGAYICRGTLSAQDLIRPSPDNPGATVKVPGKSEKVSVLFGRL